jgi:hypothetical protein
VADIVRAVQESSQPFLDQLREEREQMKQERLETQRMIQKASSLIEQAATKALGEAPAPSAVAPGPRSPGLKTQRTMSSLPAQQSWLEENMACRESVAEGAASP